MIISSDDIKQLACIIVNMRTSYTVYNIYTFEHNQPPFEKFGMIDNPHYEIQAGPLQTIYLYATEKPNKSFKLCLQVELNTRLDKTIRKFPDLTETTIQQCGMDGTGDLIAVNCKYDISVMQKCNISSGNYSTQHAGTNIRMLDAIKEEYTLCTIIYDNAHIFNLPPGKSLLKINMEKDSYIGRTINYPIIYSPIYQECINLIHPWIRMQIAQCDNFINSTPIPSECKTEHQSCRLSKFPLLGAMSPSTIYTEAKSDDMKLASPYNYMQSVVWKILKGHTTEEVIDYCGIILAKKNPHIHDMPYNDFLKNTDYDESDDQKTNIENHWANQSRKRCGLCKTILYGKYIVLQTENKQQNYGFCRVCGLFCQFIYKQKTSITLQANYLQSDVKIAVAAEDYYNRFIQPVLKTNPEITKEEFTTICRILHFGKCVEYSLSYNCIELISKSGKYRRVYVSRERQRTLLIASEFKKQHPRYSIYVC
jgi:hypothetical protein